MASKDRQKILIAIASIIGIIIFALMLSFGINKSGEKGLIKDAEKYMEEEEYKSAVEIYSRLISKTGDKKYKDKKEEAKKLEVEKNYYEIGMKKIKADEYISAINSFSKIDREDSIYYEKVKKELSKIEESIINEAKININNDNTYLASSILNDYLRAVGDSEKAKKLLQSIEGDDVAQVDPTDKDDDKKNKTNLKTEELPRDSSKWVGKTVEIKSGKANLRDDSSINGKVVGIAVEGDAITITKIYDDGGRIWCYGKITSAKTGKTETAWISSKNLQ
ncbi:SH3 domain-containing protein [Miniphocaeibacter halophilus]|uniref:Uncharacterized protein n=1 Tax=Miniphocaeibacter halophilus TaxID=2931922 RepID=A0AC61MV53_9FIRM|nr:SH3 domain-containing protein [Miniphocaeibacter halophilus]QQK08549.1 hypothetical protein JFY71_03145 [Miniphocaeibacter halophilus]